MVKAKDLTGNKFGRLLVIRLDQPIGNRRSFLCLCDCGNSKIVRSESLTAGITKSCGCIRFEKIQNLRKSHGKSKTAEYKSWNHAKSRITNKNDPKYPYYGGRGITMCQEWISSFEAFYNDMGDKPSSKHSLGRIDVNKGYYKENCRWEDSYQQARARTDNVYVNINGERLILKDACKQKGLNYKMIHGKIKSGKLTVSEVFNEKFI